MRPYPAALCRRCRRIRRGLDLPIYASNRAARESPRRARAVWASEHALHPLQELRIHPVLTADDLLHHLARAVDDVALRKLERAVARADLFFRIAGGAERDLKTLTKFF